MQQFKIGGHLFFSVLSSAKFFNKSDSKFDTSRVFELIFQYPYNVRRNSSEDFTLRYAQVTTTKTL